ncbi:MAG: hypothetical protein D6732_04520 [Methanobacteriota archaeon]|nr:MAG: hypothetical protein D6732_04520 [Euryarchaeota archaeon]
MPKIISIIKDILLIIFLSIFAYQFYYNNHNNTTSTTEGHQIKPGVAEIQTTTTNKPIKNPNKHINKPKHQTIQSSGSVKTNTHGKIRHEHSRKISSTLEKHNIKEAQIYWHDDETGLDMPIGVALYSPDKDKWITKAYDLDFTFDILETKDKKGNHHHTVSVFASPKNLKQFKGEFPLRIDTKHSNFTVVNDPPSFSLWNPTLSIGGSYDSTVGIIGKFNFLNYGDNEIPDFEFLSPTVSYHPNQKQFTFGLEGISYNIGKNTPLVKDIHIGIGINNKRKAFIDITSTL